MHAKVLSSAILDIAPIWNWMNVYDGDTMVIVDFPE